MSVGRRIEHVSKDVCLSMENDCVPVSECEKLVEVLIMIHYLCPWFPDHTHPVLFVLLAFEVVSGLEFSCRNHKRVYSFQT